MTVFAGSLAPSTTTVRFASSTDGGVHSSEATRAGGARRTRRSRRRSPPLFANLIGVPAPAATTTARDADGAAGRDDARVGTARAAAANDAIMVDVNARSSAPCALRGDVDLPDRARPSTLKYLGAGSKTQRKPGSG
eukprot:10994-Pelagococcus_subviridis.AAC.4